MRFIIISISLFLFGCNNIKTISQSKIEKDSPCGTSSKGVNVRIKNTGKIPFSKFILINTDSNYVFEGLKPNQQSCYKNLPFIRTINKCSIFFIKKNGKSFTQSQTPIDYAGESKITTGDVTIEIKTTGKKRKPGRVKIKIVTGG
jgi:hypothetical protein